jgi:hypothetical protein
VSYELRLDGLDQLTTGRLDPIGSRNEILTGTSKSADFISRNR